MNINYAVSPTFSQVHRDTSRYIFIMGPVGSGKTSGCIWHLFMNACKQIPDENGVRRSRYAVIRAHYPELKSTTIKSWIGWFKDKIKITYDIPIKAEIKYGLSDGTSINMEVLFLAVDSELNVEKLRSLEVTGCHINEAGEIDQGIFQMMKTRMNRFPAKKDGGAVDPFIILDYNAVSTDNWLYKLAEETKPEGHSFYRQPPAVLFVNNKYVVNPEAENLMHLSETYYTDMCLGNDSDFIYVNVMNNYGETRSGKPVYKDYEDTIHCSKQDLQPAKGIQLVIGMDQGLRPAAVFTQQLPDGTVQVLDEIVTEDCSLQEFCNDMLIPLLNNKYKDFKKNYYVVCDPATTQRSMNDSKAGTEVLRELGIKYRTAKTNAFMARKEAVVYFLRLQNKFKLSPSCTYLRKGFINEYHFDEIRHSQSDMFKDRPTKNIYSNPHDALQYACLEFYHKNTHKRPEIKRRNYKVGSAIGGY